MKRSLGLSLRVLAAVIAFALLLCCNISTYASYNDERFEVYVNMNNKVTTKYVVPNLYRQDGAYTYVKSFPLVVSGDVEYVPISVFSLYSYLSVTYSKTSDDFYMTNTKTGRYLSFDVSRDVAETNDGEIMSMKTRIYYQTRYVPARDVAQIFGLSCESYDDPESGIYAFRVKDSAASLSFEALLDRYLPKKKEPVPEQNMPEPDDTPNSEQQPDSQTDKPSVPNNPDNGSQTQKPETSKPQEPVEVQPEDPYEKIADRDVCFIFSDFDADYADGVLSVLSENKTCAAFALDFDDAYENPETVRDIVVGGHALAVTAELDENADFSDAEKTAQSLAEQFDKANEALYAAVKRKTRLCVVSEQLEDGGADIAAVKNALEKAGYAVVSFDADAKDNPLGRVRIYAVYNNIVNSVTGAAGEKEYARVVIKLRMGEKSAEYMRLAARFLNKYPQFKALGINETMFALRKGDGTQ